MNAAKHVTWDDLFELAQFARQPCVSIYFGTHHGQAGEQSIASRVSHLVQRARAKLREVDAPGSEAMLLPAEERAKAIDKLPIPDPGVAWALGPQFFRQFAMPTTVADTMRVGAHFDLLPLVSCAAENERFWILALSKKRVRLIRADRNGAEEIEAPRLGLGIEAMLQLAPQERVRQAVTVSGRGGRQSASVFHGQGNSTEHAKAELREYLQQIDHEVCRILAEAHGPLVIAAVDEECAAYRDLSKYRHIAAHSLTGNPDLLSIAELQRRAWPLIAESQREHIEHNLAHTPQCKTADAFRNALPDLYDAAKAGLIETLYVVRGTSVWVQVDSKSNEIGLVDGQSPLAQNLIEVLARDVLAHRGKVVVVESNQLPAVAPLAAHRRDKQPTADTA